MNEKKDCPELEEMTSLALDCMGVAVSIIDHRGTLLYYNPHAERILDRKPEYIGHDVHSHHKKAMTNDKLDAMLRAFSQGRQEPFRYEATPYGTPIFVTVSPILKNGQFLGCVQTVILKEELPEKARQ